MTAWCRMLLSIGALCAALVWAAAAQDTQPPSPSGAAAGAPRAVPVQAQQASIKNPLAGKPEAIAAGRQLFQQYHCVGCHSPGGGGAMGPSLIDSQWIYGSAPGSIFETILRGRPNGMPSFGGILSPDQVWQLAAYIDSISAPPAATSQTTK